MLKIIEIIQAFLNSFSFFLSLSFFSMRSVLIIISNYTTYFLTTPYYDNF